MLEYFSKDIADMMCLLNTINAKLENSEKNQKKSNKLSTLSYSQAYQLAYVDPLTGLPNRRLLADRLHQITLKNKRSKTYSAAIFIDLDKFKSVNDHLGHAAGDQLLVEVGSRLRLCLRETDTVARYGGDEFVVLLDHLNGGFADAKKQAYAIGLKILHILLLPYDLPAQDKKHSTMHSVCRVDASVGISVFNGAVTDEDNIFSNADKIMYCAKKDGGKCVRIN